MAEHDIEALRAKADETLDLAMKARAAFAAVKAQPLSAPGRKKALIKLYREVADTHYDMWCAQEALFDADRS
jgi:hypothetical protein